MTTRITGTGVETGETDTDTITGGITDGQLIRGLLDRGLSLNSNGEIVVENSQKVGGQTVSGLLGQYSFSGRAMHSSGGNVIHANTDASGDPSSIEINPGRDFASGVNFSGEVTQDGSPHVGEPGGEFEAPLLYNATNQLGGNEHMFQVRSFNLTPLFTVENGAGARTTTYNKTLTIGGDERDDTSAGSGPVGTRVQFGYSKSQIKARSDGELVAADTNGNFTTIT